MFERLQLPDRPPMTDPGYLDAVQRAAVELRRAQPWLLVSAAGEPLFVAHKRTLATWLLVKLVNLWRRPRRWWLGRLQLAYEARQAKGNRNA